MTKTFPHCANLTSCRPATLTLQRDPLFVGSTPDGSCLCSIGANADGGFTIEAYHWASFGSKTAHEINIPNLKQVSAGTISLTSFVDRSRVHLLVLDLQSSRCRSFALDVTKKTTEYAFKAKGTALLSIDPSSETSTNIMIECLFDVWTRFPVVPAINRATITAGRRPPRITYVTDRDHSRYPAHFTESIRVFKRSTRKPTARRLSAIAVTALPFNVVATKALHPDLLSSLKAGEWLIETICLIPLQIAVTRENRLVSKLFCRNDSHPCCLGSSRSRTESGRQTSSAVCLEHP